MYVDVYNETVQFENYVTHIKHYSHYKFLGCDHVNEANDLLSSCICVRFHALITLNVCNSVQTRVLCIGLRANVCLFV